MPLAAPNSPAPPAPRGHSPQLDATHPPDFPAVHHPRFDTVFEPDDEIVSDILQCLTDPHCPFAEVAIRYKVSIEALALWLARPETRERVNTYRRAAALHVQMTAERELPIAAHALVRSIDDALYELTKCDWNPIRNGWTVTEQRRRARETVRKQVHLLRSLSKYTPTDPFAQPPPSHAPRGGGAESARRRESDSPEAPTPAPSPAPGGGGARVREGGGGSDSRTDKLTQRNAEIDHYITTRAAILAQTPPAPTPSAPSALSAHSDPSAYSPRNGHKPCAAACKAPCSAAPPFTPVTVTLTPARRLATQAGAPPPRPPA
ncbi:hypothetical protein PHYC_01819 [Phycisphaerales bacterium]|nr:hypothetical protein PHYC_01819 [Phycisphaerales bacterium]